MDWGYVKTELGRRIPLGAKDTIGRVAGHYARGTANEYAKLALLELNTQARARFNPDEVRMMGLIGGNTIWEVLRDVHPWDVADVFQGCEEVVAPVHLSIKAGRNLSKETMEEIT